MIFLCRGALKFLEEAYSEDDARFPFTSHLVGQEYRRVFGDAMTNRSTINCLLGLQEAARHAPDHSFLRLTDRHIERFVARHESTVAGPADLGLLLMLLSGSQLEAAITLRTLSRIRALLNDDRAVGHLNVQDVSWLLWGCLAAVRNGVPDTDPLTRRLFRILTDRFLQTGAVLPSHQSRRGRFGVVSFGACTYFLRAVHDYGEHYQDATADQLFRTGVDRLLAAQGPMGEWPWLLRSSDGRPLDFYPVFSVHQNSMSILFLGPAAAAGVPGVEPAMAKSLAWLTGTNQLGLPMVQSDPFFIYRSLERRAALPRPQRFVRALMVSASGRPAELAANDRLVVNRESRSYELGWILYALSGREAVSGLDKWG